MGTRHFCIALVIGYKFRSHGLCFSKACEHVLSHRKHVIPPKLQALNYKKASPFPSSIMDLQSDHLCLCCFPLISCASLHILSVFLTTHNRPVHLVTGGWKTQMSFCSEQNQCCFLLYACASFSF